MSALTVNSKFNQLRFAQQKVVEIVESTSKSGVFVLPPGAGKTACILKSSLREPSLILCNNVAVARQIRREFLKETNLTPNQVACSPSEELNASTIVLICTYQRLAQTEDKMSACTLSIMSSIRTNCWRLLILDEVHKTKAMTFSALIRNIRPYFKRLLGFTGTIVGNTLDGPLGAEANILYRFAWKKQAEDGSGAEMRFFRVDCQSSVKFDLAIDTLKNGAFTSQEAINIQKIIPEKLEALAIITKTFGLLGRTGLVFCDKLFTLKVCSRLLGANWQCVSSETALSQRESYYKALSEGRLSGIIATSVLETG